MWRREREFAWDCPPHEVSKEEVGRDRFRHILAEFLRDESLDGLVKPGHVADLNKPVGPHQSSPVAGIQLGGVQAAR